MKKTHRKAQIRLDFITGFFLFIVTVAYIAFTVTNAFPRYIAQSSNNNLKLEAWQASENFMRIAEKRGAFDTSEIGNFSLCFRYDYSNISSRNNYTSVKNRLNISDSNSIHLTFDKVIFAVTNAGNSTDRYGTALSGGILYPIYVRNISFYFNETRNSTGPWTNDTILIGGEKYDVLKIDYDGDFVIFRKRIADCGPNIPVYAANAIVRRYGVYNGSFAFMELAYWR